MDILRQAVLNPTSVVQNSQTQAYHDELHRTGGVIKNDPFFMAAKSDRADIIRAIIEHVPANLVAVTDRRDQSGYHPIHHAAASGHVDVVSVLLEKKPDLWRKRDGRGWTPLHHAISNSSVPVIEVILRTDLAAIRDVTLKMETCLHIAVKHKGLEQLQLLLQRLGDEDRNELINHRDVEGNTILHIAVSYRLFNILKSIIGIRYGPININIENADGLTALNLCDRGKKDLLIEQHLREAGGERTFSLIATIDPFLHSTTAERQVILVIPVGVALAAATQLGNNLEKKEVLIQDVLTFRDHHSSLKFYWTLSLTILFMFSIFILGLALWSSPTGQFLLIVLPFLVTLYGLALFSNISSFSIVWGSLTIPSILIVGFGVLVFFVTLTLYLLLGRQGQRLIRYLRRRKVQVIPP